MRRFFISGLLVASLVVLVGVGFLAWIGSEGGLTPVAPASTNAREIQDVYIFVGAFASAIFLIVTIPLALFVVRFRRAGRDPRVEGPQIRGHVRLELAWTAIPVAIVVVIATYTFLKLPGIREPAAAAGEANLTVKVDGRQFSWQFEYENGVISIDRLRVPVDQNIHLDVTAPDADVAHSFWVPALGGKIDAIPGVENDLVFRATRTGEFQGKCAELCGIQHSAMLLTVEVLPKDEFERWLEQEGDAQEAGKSKLGEQIFTRVCSKCHFAAPEYAPNIAGNPILADPAQVERIVRNGIRAMPAVGAGWSDRQVEALTDYLKTIAPQEAGGGG